MDCSSGSGSAGRWLAALRASSRLLRLRSAFFCMIIWLYRRRDVNIIGILFKLTPYKTHRHTQEYRRLWERVQLFMKCSSTYMIPVLNSTLRILIVIQSLLWANAYNMYGIQVSTSLVSIPQFHMKHHRTDCLSQEQKELLTPTPTSLPNTLIIFLASCKWRC